MMRAPKQPAGYIFRSVTSSMSVPSRRVKTCSWPSKHCHSFPARCILLLLDDLLTMPNASFAMPASTILRRVSTSFAVFPTTICWPFISKPNVLFILPATRGSAFRSSKPYRAACLWLPAQVRVLKKRVALRAYT